ncbi:MAG: alanine racemase [Clostridia bacterium]|nr:alanine racemase [Clostridia bacterium]
MGNIRRNAQRFVSLTGEELCAVVKANAYGHGAEEVVNALEGVASCFAVALIEEGLAIRTAACGKDILVFSPPICEEEGLAIAENGFIATVPDLWTAKLLAKICGRRGLPLRVHLKTNTGMNRYGMNGSALGKVCKYLSDKPYVQVEGIYTHLYGVTRAQAEEQRRLFLKHLDICKRYFPSVNVHMGGTYAALLGEDFRFGMTRVGLGLYGYLPTAEGVTAELSDALGLEKGMTVQTKVAANRLYSFGGVGYGKNLSAEEKSGVKRLAVCRFGYADGFLRKRENGTCHSEENANTLCMDVCIRKNGKRRGQRIEVMSDAAQTANATGTIPYEVLCAATRRAEFVYDND